MATFDELLRKIQAQKSVNKVPTVQPAVTPPPTIPSRVQPTEAQRTTSLPDRKAYEPITRQGYEEALKTNAWARFHAGTMEGLSPLSYKPGIEKQYGADTLDALQNSGAYTAGQIAGTVGQFATGYGAAAPKTGSLLAKAPAFAKAGKIGQGVMRSVATDLAVGFPLNVNYAFNKEQLRGIEALKSIGLNTAIDLVAGGVLEVVGGVILKSGKKVASKAEFDMLPAPEREEVLLMLEAPAQETKLLTEGINWTPGKAPTFELPEPKMYVDLQGGASFNPERAAAPNVETIINNKDIDTIRNRMTEGDLLFDPVEIDVFNDSDLNLLNMIRAQFPGRDAKAVLDSFHAAVDKEVESLTKEVADYFYKYKPQGTTLIPDQLDATKEFNKLRVSQNEPWYSSFYAKYKRKPNKADSLELAQEYVNAELTRGGGEYVDGKLAADYAISQQAKKISASLKPGLKDAVKNSDGSYSLVYGDEQRVLRPNYAAAKGQVETPFIASQSELSFVPRPAQRKSAQLGIPTTNRAQGSPAPAQRVSAANNGNVPLAKKIAETGNFPKGAHKDLGADIMRPNKTADELVEQYGAFNAGATPRVEGRPVPKATDAGPVQQGMRTMAEAPAISEESYKEILSVIEEGAAWKPIIKNETVVNKANALIASEGLEASYGRFSSVLADGKQARSEDIALGYRLMQEYQAKKDFARVANIAVDVSEMLSQSGRSLQASSIIKALSPEGRLMAVQRVANRLSEQHDVRIDLDEETIAKIFGAKTEKEIFEAQHEAVVKMWSMIPPGLLNCINSWRYMAMLTNPKTHVRNILGNAFFLPAREVKNLVGAGLEKAAKVPVGQRTKAVINPFNASDQALISFADKHFAEVLPIMGGTRLDDVARPLDAAVFSKKWEAPVEAVRKGNLAFMTATDDAFKRIAWDSSFAQYMKANKLTPDTITAKQILAGREYAVNEALKATYQDASTLSKAIARLKSNLATKKGATPQATAAKQLGSFALEGLIPFSKTPINLVRRGFEYSPVGLMGSVADVISAARKGKGMAAALDKMAAGLTGTGVMALGAWLGKSGIVVGGSDEAYNSKLSQFDRATGMQEYAIDTGDGTYTIDWAAPMSMPFFVGVEIAKGLDSEGLAAVLESMTSIDEPVMNLSMLKGINDALRTYSQEDSALGQIATNMMISYLGQFVPTLGGQVARTLDDTRRTTTSTDESALVRKLKKAGNAQLGKVPFANQNLEPYINLWGETESSGTAFGNFINPGYYKEKSTSALDDEIRRVAEAAGEEGTKAIPRLISGYTLTADKQSYRLTEKELTKFKQIQGQESKKSAEKLIRSAEYKKMSDEDKAKALDKVYSDAFQAAKWAILKQRSVFPVSDKKTTRF